MRDIKEVQRHLAGEGFDGWLLYDFKRSNDLACAFLEIPHEAHLTRRFFYWIPAKGEPVAIVSIIEPHVLNHLPGEKRLFLEWQAMEKHLGDILRGKKRIAMEYAPRCSMPYVSKVDAGTLEIVRSFGVEIGTSASFLQYYTCVWTDKQLQSHLGAADVLDNTAAKTWEFIGSSLAQGRPITEYDVQQFILGQIEESGCVMDGEPIAAVNANSANPHYMPAKSSGLPVKKGDFILIDLWCKKKGPDSVYADITRVAVAAREATERQNEIFHIVRKAQKAAADFVQERVSKKQPVRGCEADAVCRKAIADAGYGKYFIHRTGHNIHTETHGPGAHLDSLETNDERLLIPRTCFSIEPGIYIPGEFGVRLEHDVYIGETGSIRITGGVQEKILCIG